MVAYSFRPRFAPPILVGLEPGPLLPGMKRQTIRADRKRHARPGEELQLYTGMRTRSCKLLGRSLCTSVSPIALVFSRDPEVFLDGSRIIGAAELDVFAGYDGFGDFGEMRAFWEAEHDGHSRFSGILIRWEPKARRVSP